MFGKKFIAAVGALIVGSAGFASAGTYDNNSNWRLTFVGGHEPMRQFRVEPVADKDAPYELVGRDSRESTRNVGAPIRVGSRIVGFMPAGSPDIIATR